MTELKTRSRNKGLESEMVQSFIESNNLFKKPNLNYIILEETYAEIGIPDLLIISWPKTNKINWNSERNNLKKKDIKILHHISTSNKKGLKIIDIICQLGFDEKTVSKSLAKLDNSNLIRIRGKKIYIYKFRSNFFIREIVAIEAKLNNTKKAIIQAEINRNFSSLSYVLLPEKKTLKNYTSDIGLITFNGEKAKVKKKARRLDLPGSYFSWILNEHIGRKLYG